MFGECKTEELKYQEQLIIGAGMIKYGNYNNMIMLLKAIDLNNFIRFL